MSTDTDNILSDIGTEHDQEEAKRKVAEAFNELLVGLHQTNIWRPH